MLRKIWILLVLIATQAIQAQEMAWHHRVLTVDDGLSSNLITSGLQDSRGIIWLGTNDGINRYDGTHIDHITKANGLQSDNVAALAEDNDNNIWALYGRSEGRNYSAFMVDILNTYTGEISSFQNKFPSAPFDIKDILWILSDGKRGVYIVVKPYKIYYYHKETGFQKKEEDNNIFYNEAFNHISQTRGENYWIFCTDHLKIKQKKVLYQHYNRPTYHCLGDNQVSYLLPYSDNDGLNLDIETFNENSQTIKKTIKVPNTPELANTNIGPIFQIYDNTSCSVMFGYNSQLFIGNSDKIYKLPFKLEDLKIITGIFQDSQGIFWICTTDGLHQIYQKPVFFNKYFSTKDGIVYFSGNQVRSILADENGNIWCSIFGLIYHYDARTQKYSFIKDLYQEALAFIDGKDKIYSFCSDFCYTTIDKSSLNLQNHFLNKDSEKKYTNQIILGYRWSAYQINTDKFLCGGVLGFCNWDISTQIQTQPIVPSNFPSPHEIYRILHDDKAKVLWACGESGLYCLKEDGSEVIDYIGPSATDDSHKLPISKLHDFIIDKNGIFWMAANGTGLVSWNPKNNTTKIYTKANGLPSNRLYCILEDDFNNLWVTTDRGLVKFNKNTEVINIFTQKDGLSENEFNRVSKFKAPDGRIYFGTIDGLTSFQPKDLADYQAQSQRPISVISLIQFESGGVGLVNRSQEYFRNNTITINPDDQFSELRFALLDYMNPVLRYSYMIEGIDKDWNIITEGKIRISGLPYGNFNLRIRAQSSDGSWSKSELNIPVIVRKPFYMSWWFTLSVLVILGSLVYGYIEFRTRNLQKTKMLLEKTVEDRTQQLKGLVSQKDLMMKEIHHRVKNNLQVISGLLELQKARSSDDQVKAALVESQNRVLSIAFIHQNLYQHEDLKGVQIKGFVEELTQHIKSLFRKESCIVTAELDIDNIFIDIDTAVPLGLIINELLTNSFKYAFPDRNNGHISIHIHRTAEHIYKMRYHDNGIGLPIGINTDKPKSLGMRLINRLSKQLDGDMVYTFEGGSCFSLIFKDSELRNNT